MTNLCNVWDSAHKRVYLNVYINNLLIILDSRAQGNNGKGQG